MGIKETASLFCTSRNTVRKYVSVCFFQAGKVLNSFFLFPMNSCMRSSVVRSPVIGNLQPERLNWKPCFPGMYPV